MKGRATWGWWGGDVICQERAALTEIKERATDMNKPLSKLHYMLYAAKVLILRVSVCKDMLDSRELDFLYNCGKY